MIMYYYHFVIHIASIGDVVCSVTGNVFFSLRSKKLIHILDRSFEMHLQMFTKILGRQ